MKLILTQDVPSLGLIGEVVNVKDGYARNFLLPKGVAVPSTPQNMKLMEELKKKRQVEAKKTKDEALAVSERLADVSCTIPVKIIEEDRIFGSVTPEMIQKAFEAEGIRLDKRTIHIEEPIKKLGVYQVSVKLHPEVTVSCKVWVVKE
ncbi:MAG: 50S ribosomal protein L9 [Candidatus Omnitrophica bacterium]|nr:50S ribosomal protein L9 [Candidatus Omnitrophota bacterium]